LDGVLGQPEAGTAGALEDRHRGLAELTTGQVDGVGARGAWRQARFSGSAGRQQRGSAVMAIAGTVTDACHARWADSVQIPLVEGEVCVAEAAGSGFCLARRSARRAADHGGVVR
jgi:hypothetical protein